LGSLKGRRQSENLGVDGRIIIKMDLKEIGLEDVDWISLAQNRDKSLEDIGEANT
jgi:hypothetical protein